MSDKISPLRPIRVEAHSGYKDSEEPRAVFLDGDRHQIAGIGDRWVDPEADYFKVRTEHGLLLLLKRNRNEDVWYLVTEERTDG